MRRGASSRAGFWAVAYALAVLIGGANLATPLYEVYRSEFGFSPAVLTLVFATYAFVLIPALVVFGQLSDSIGRRRVLLVGLALAGLGSLFFAVAQGTAWLFAARAIQGLAIGAAQGAATAALAELRPGDGRYAALVASVAILGGGALGTFFGGVLAEYAIRPLELTFLAHLVLVGVALVGVWVMGEPGATGGAWRPHVPNVPKGIRGPFARASATAFAGWAVTGLFLSVIPSYALSVLGTDNTAVAGGATFAMLASSAAVQLGLRSLPARSAELTGLALLVAGLAGVVAAAPAGSLALLLAGTLSAGAGQGLAFMGSLGTVGAIAPAEGRGGVISAFYVVNYLGVSIPVVGLGVLAEPVGLFAALLVFAVVVGLLCALAAALLLASGFEAQGGSPAARRTR